jgi:Family of unknown function (DUF6328)
MADRPSGRVESEDERLDRNLAELLQELRVALPGVQVLFAFLLAVPFQQGFERISSFQKHVYLVVLICTAVSSALLIAPTALHRLLFARGHKPEIIRYANRMVIYGLVLLAVAMVGVVLLITHELFGPAAAIAITAPIAAVFLVTWFVIPLVRREDAE